MTRSCRARVVSYCAARTGTFLFDLIAQFNSKNPKTALEEAFDEILSSLSLRRLKSESNHPILTRLSGR